LLSLLNSNSGLPVRSGWIHFKAFKGVPENTFYFNMGRFKLIDTPETLWELFLDYKTETKSNPFLIHDYVGGQGIEVRKEKERCLTTEGFEDFVADIPNMPMDLGDYFANTKDAYANFSTICSRIKRAIRKDQIEGGMSGVYNPSITQRLNNLVDKKENTIIQEQPLFPEDE